MFLVWQLRILGNLPYNPVSKSCSVGASGDIAARCTPHTLLRSLLWFIVTFLGTFQEKMTIKPISSSISPTILWPHHGLHFPQGWSSGRVEPSGLSPWCLSFFYLNLQQFYACSSLLFNVTFFLLVWFNLLTNYTRGWPEPLWRSEVDHVTQKLQTSPPYSGVSTVIILWGLLRHCGPRTLSHLPKVTHPANEGLLLSQICFLQISKFTELDCMVSGLNSCDYQLQ